MRSARGPLQGVDHQQQFHQVAIHRRAGRLDDEDVRAAHIFLDLQMDFAIGEWRTMRLAEWISERLADLVRERGIGVPSENFETVVDSSRIPASRRPCRKV